MALDLTKELSLRQRTIVLAACVAVTAILLFYERHFGPALSLGPLFFLPLLVAAAFIPRWPSFLVANGVAVLREALSPALTDDQQQIARLALSMVAFSGATLFAGELVRNRRIVQALALKNQEEARLRSDAAQEIRALIEGTPAAVLTVDPKSNIAMANGAAKRLLGFEGLPLEGEPIGRFLPILGKLLKSSRKVNMLSSMVEAGGTRRQGEPFHAQMWVSSYDSAQGPRLAAIIGDATENLRDREETGLRQLLMHSRIIAGAVSHEIRNLTGGAAVLYDNLSRVDGLTVNPDFQAMGSVIESILKLSSDELQENAEEVLDGVDIQQVMDELQLIVMPAFEEAGARLLFEIGKTLVPVRANHAGLLQVFINLAQNSARALKGVPSGCLRITVYQLNDAVIIRFTDNGPGLPADAKLFQPFLGGSSSAGLGLFISRSIVRTFGGELHHTQKPGECCFIVEVPCNVAWEAASA